MTFPPTCLTKYVSSLFLACATFSALSQFTHDGGTIIGYIGPGGNVDVPISLDGILMTNLGNALFEYSQTLTSISIPDSVTSIGSFAFDFCTSLTNVTLGLGLAAIGEGAFSSCTSLEKVSLPASVTDVGPSVFSLSAVKSVTLPAGVTNADGAFWQCPNLLEIRVDPLNTSYSDLDGVLFNKDQTALLQFPGGRLGSYTIPASVAEFGSGAFQWCLGLTALTVNSSNSTFSSVDGVVFDKNRTKLIQFPVGRAGSYTIPNGVTTIGFYSFSGSSQLTMVDFPNSLTKIEGGAFSYCTNLTDVTIPAGVSSLGEWTFSECGGLASITLPDSLSLIGSGMFHGCGGLTNITLPNGVTSIGSSAFAWCTNLTRITLPEALRGIFDYAFSWNVSLKSITIPAAVTFLGRYAFADSHNLAAVYCAGDAPSADWSTFVDIDRLAVYRLPGTHFWGESLGDRWVGLWLPQVQSVAPGDSGDFKVVIAWANGKSITLESTSSLGTPIWLPVSTNTVFGGSVSFTDPGSRLHSSRFYRCYPQ